jgi:monovalent cation:proton antiporter-2 (CPA2) family protein
MRELFIYLLAMVLVVPISKWIGLGSVIGYLIAGALIGPQGLSLISTSSEGTTELAEFGIIMMLLLIGLELNPSVLWRMRGPIFGLGSLQVIGTTFFFSTVLSLTGTPWTSAVAMGMIVCVSSTAIALQTLQEQGYAKSVSGERAFAVLLFQDIAVIPILAILALLGADSSANAVSSFHWKNALFVVGAVSVVIFGGSFAVRPLFKWIARTKLRETFTALALLIVVAAAILMHSVGLSPALGAFLAGVVLADSEFRHQIEADIEPFKGLLLGLFFITVGSNIQFDVIARHPWVVGGGTLGIIAGKAILLYAIARVSKMRPPESLLFATALAQGGEFAFVLMSQSKDLISTQTAQILTASIVLSMAAAPLFIRLTIQKGMSRLERVKPEAQVPDTVDEGEKENPVLVIGIGRFGQTLVRFLRANGYHATVLDIDSEQIELTARFGFKSYFGDGANLDLLRAAGLDRTQVLVLAIDEHETALKIVQIVRSQYPNLPIFSRAYDRIHAYKMLHLGVNEIAIETSGSALDLGTAVLKALGVREDRAESKAKLFAINNQRSIRDLSVQFHELDRETFIQATRQMAEQLDALFKSDPEELLQGAASQWPPVKEEPGIPALK